MLKNYFKMFIRIILKQKLIFLINCLGLTIGLSSSILVFLFVQEELRYDSYHSNLNQVYRIVREDVHEANKTSRFSPGTSGALAPALLDHFPEVKSTFRMRLSSIWVSHQNQGFTQTFCIADPSIFDILTLPSLTGDPKEALKEPNTVLITETVARRYFGNKNPIGKMIEADSWFKGNYRVTGILKDIPKQSTIQFDMIAPPSAKMLNGGWGRWNAIAGWLPISTYVLLKKRHDPKGFEKKLPDIILSYMGQKAQSQIRYHIQPQSRIHLYSYSDFGLKSNGDINTIFALSSLAIFVLLIAIVNFVNLSTARVTNRAKEISVRKVTGASRVQLTRQFIWETVLLALIALLISLGLSALSLPYLNAFLGKELALSFDDITLIPFLISMTLCVGLLAGSYPAFVLSSLQPIDILTGQRKQGRIRHSFRKGLVIVQFALAILLLVGTFTIHNQLTFINNKDLGFNKDHVITLLMFKRDPTLSKKRGLIKREFLKLPGVLHAAITSASPFGAGAFERIRVQGAQGEWRMRMQDIDFGSLDTYGIKVITGRDISQDIASDQNEAFLLNETAVQKLGIENPIGKKLEMVTWNNRKGTIIGIVKDFHFRPLREPIEPLFMAVRGYKQVISLRVTSENLSSTVQDIEQLWKQFLPTRPFEFAFMNEQLDSWYKQEQKLSQLCSLMAMIAIFTACMGLYALSTFMADQRTKEVGIRKVLGASISSIVRLFSYDFLKPVLLANVLALPLAYYIMTQWLTNFAYRIELGIEILSSCSLLALAIALLTISLQAIKSATSNPVDVLRKD